MPNKDADTPAKTADEKDNEAAARRAREREWLRQYSREPGHADPQAHGMSSPGVANHRNS